MLVQLDQLRELNDETWGKAEDEEKDFQVRHSALFIFRCCCCVREVK